MPFKDFNAGEVLSSADVDLYLMGQAVIRCTSGTRPASPAAGWHIWETDTKRMLWYSGSVWIAYPKVLMAVKSSDQSINTTSATNVTGMTVPLDANAQYLIEGYFRINVPSGTNAGPLVFGWTVPASSTWHWTNNTLATATSSSSDAIYRLAQSGDLISGGTLNGSGTSAMLPRGWIQTAGTAGNLQLQIRNQVGVATNPGFIYTGSWMRITRFEAGF